MERQTTAGGTARLCRIGTDRFKAGLLSVLAAIPIDRESACLAPLLLSVLRRGTKHYPTLTEVNRRLDRLWGTAFSIRSSYRGDLLLVGFSAGLLDGSYLPEGGDELLHGVTDLMREILLEPIRDADGLLSARYVESEKQLQIDAIRAQKNNPAAYAADRAKALLFAEEPCGIPLLGTEEETAAVTREQLTAYYDRFLAAFRPIVFSVGSTSAERLSRELDGCFGGRLTAPDALPCSVHRLAKRDEPLRVTEQLEVAQSQLVLGLRTGILLGDAAFCACSVYNEMLGVSPVSRLFTYVREKQSLCYSCSSTYRGTHGSITVACGIKRENRERAEAEILHQLDLLCRGDFTDDELNAAKNSLVNAYRQFSDSASGMESFRLGRMLACGEDAPTAEESILGIERVSREDVIRIAREVTVEVIYFLEGTLAEEDTDDEDD